MIRGSGAIKNDSGGRDCAVLDINNAADDACGLRLQRWNLLAEGKKRNKAKNAGPEQLVKAHKELDEIQEILSHSADGWYWRLRYWRTGAG